MYNKDKSVEEKMFMFQLEDIESIYWDELMGQTLAELRGKISQTKIATLSQLSRANLSLIETGNAKTVPMTTLVRVCHAMNISVSYFMLAVQEKRILNKLISNA
jgi:DNA-binding Xre family transcriptional regulator